MAIDLPTPIAIYLAAERNADTDVLAQCFAPDAVVHDEGQTIRGLDAIKSWKQAAQAKYRYTVEPLDATRYGESVRMRARLTGQFPGSPIEVVYTFTLAGDRIAALQIV